MLDPVPEDSPSVEEPDAEPLNKFHLPLSVQTRAEKIKEKIPGTLLLYICSESSMICKQGDRNFLIDHGLSSYFSQHLP